MYKYFILGFWCGFLALIIFPDPKGIFFHFGILGIFDLENQRIDQQVLLFQEKLLDHSLLCHH